MKRLMTPLATIAGIAVIFGNAHGQATPVATPAQGDSAKPSGQQPQKPAKDKKPAATDSKTADQTKKGDGDKTKDADESEPRPLYNSLDILYKTWQTSGYGNAM